MKKETDFEKVNIRATELAADMSKALAKPGLTSMGDSIIAMMLGVCKLIQMVSLIMGRDPKQLADIFLKGMKIYFDTGGDKYMTEFYESLNEETN